MSRADFLIQCASYALEMMSHGRLRSHVFGVLITDSKLEVLYYDHSSVVMSEAVDFVETPTHLVALLEAMSKTGDEGWGYVSRLKPPTPAGTHPDLLQGALLELEAGRKLDIGNLVFRQHALIGRGTCVLHAKSKSHPGVEDDWETKSLIVKLSFTPDTRTSEGKFLENILKVANSDEKHHWVKNHLPEVLYYQTLPPVTVQERLAEYCSKHNISYERRTVQALIMTELHPVTRIKSSVEFAPVIKGVFNCKFA